MSICHGPRNGCKLCFLNLFLPPDTLPSFSACVKSKPPTPRLFSDVVNDHRGATSNSTFIYFSKNYFVPTLCQSSHFISRRHMI